MDGINANNHLLRNYSHMQEQRNSISSRSSVDGAVGGGGRGVAQGGDGALDSPLLRGGRQEQAQPLDINYYQNLSEVRNNAVSMANVPMNSTTVGLSGSEGSLRLVRVPGYGLVACLGTANNGPIGTLGSSRNGSRNVYSALTDTSNPTRHQTINSAILSGHVGPSYASGTSSSSMSRSTNICTNAAETLDTTSAFSSRMKMRTQMAENVYRNDESAIRSTSSLVNSRVVMPSVGTPYASAVSLPSFHTSRRPINGDDVSSTARLFTTTVPFGQNSTPLTGTSASIIAGNRILPNISGVSRTDSVRMLSQHQPLPQGGQGGGDLEASRFTYQDSRSLLPNPLLFNSVNNSILANCILRNGDNYAPRIASTNFDRTTSLQTAISQLQGRSNHLQQRRQHQQQQQQQHRQQQQKNIFLGRQDSSHENINQLITQQSRLQKTNFVDQDNHEKNNPLMTKRSRAITCSNEDAQDQNVSKRASTSTNERPDEWEHYYNMLKVFKTEYGHIHVPATYKKDMHLARWVSEQRHFFRDHWKTCVEENEDGEVDIDPVTQSRIACLGQLGFTRKKKPGTLWMAQYELLKNFKDKFGHCHVPMHYKDDKKLGHWVNNQRQLYRKYKNGLPTSMSETRIELLEDLNFAWILGKDWKDKRKEDAMRNISSPFDVPAESYEIENGQSDSNCMSSSLAFQQNNAVEIGNKSTPIEDDISSKKRGHLPRLELQEARPNLIEKGSVPDLHNPLKLRESHLGKRKRPKIPVVEVNGRQLSHILFSPSPGDFDMSDNSSNSSDDDDDSSVQSNNDTMISKKITVTKIQSAKRVAYNTDKHWIKRFNDLVEFKATYGHCAVPLQYPENKSLSYWVNNQRQKYRKWLQGEDNGLNQKRIDALTNLGFSWYKHKRKGNGKGDTTNTIGVETLIRYSVDPLLTEFKDCIIYSILSFLSDVRDIVSFSTTNKHNRRIVSSPQDACNNLFKHLYLLSFGAKAELSAKRGNPNRLWLDTWKDIFRFKAALEAQADLEEGTVAVAKEAADTIDRFEYHTRSKSSIGILSERKESQAIIFDNPPFVSTGETSKYSTGYSGMLFFHIALSPPMACIQIDTPVIYKEQIAIWGDFDGLRVCDSLDNVFEGKKISFQSIGESRIGHVVTVISSPQLPIRKESYHPRRPCLYLGCRSGAIIGTFPVPCQKESLQYGISAMTFAHTGGVVALSLLPASPSSRGSKVLVSAGQDGKVFAYLNAFSSRHQFEIHSRVLCCESSEGLVALECSNSNSPMIIYTADTKGTIVIWRPRTIPTSKRIRDQANIPLKDCYLFEPVLNIPPIHNDHQISKLILASSDTLVSGSTSGDIQVWDIFFEVKKRGKRKKREASKYQDAMPGLRERFMIPMAHSGNITSLEFIGDLLLSTGGNDGFTKVWSMLSPQIIGSIVSYERRMKSLPPPENFDKTEKQAYSQNELKCSVVSNFIHNSSLISFSRDGLLSSWHYRDISQKTIIEKAAINIKNDCALKEESVESENSESSDEDNDSDANYAWECRRCNKTNASFFTKCSSCYLTRSANVDEDED